MKRIFSSRDIQLIIIAFLLSRVILSFFSIHLDYSGILGYWQYLDLETLRHNLLKGVWYNHAQPPVFNLLLGIVLKVSGEYAQYVFIIILKLISLANSLLLYSILRKNSSHRFLPVILSLIYLLSPATLLFENELFYTGFVSLILLLCVFFLVRLNENISRLNIVGFFLLLVTICLTRSLYHFFFLLCISIIVVWHYRQKTAIKGIITGALFSLIIVGGWYIKNYIIFNSFFSTSSWTGMNIARNVFHDTTIKDSTKIESIEPFSKIPAYKNFISENYKTKYAGLNDRDLLQETKNDTFLNANSAAYLEISKKYMVASKEHIKKHPVSYLKNVVQSSIIFFAPATRYSIIETMSKKIKYYDIVYSFNLTHFAQGKQQRRIALVLSALPKILLYGFILLMLVKTFVRERKISLIQVYIAFTILFIFSISSFFEHYENMRFRYEAEPLFLILAGTVITAMLNRRAKSNYLARDSFKRKNIAKSDVLEWHFYIKLFLSRGYHNFFNTKKP